MIKHIKSLFGARKELKLALTQLQWEKDRFALIAEVFKWSAILAALPQASAHAGFRDAPGGNIAFEGTMLNFATLKEMTMHLLVIERDRQAVMNNLKKALRDIEMWQQEHPHPAPEDPTVWKNEPPEEPQPEPERTVIDTTVTEGAPPALGI